MKLVLSAREDMDDVTPSEQEIEQQAGALVNVWDGLGQH